MILKQIVIPTGRRIRCFVVIALCLNNITLWADNNRLSKTSIHEIRHIYARYDIPIGNDVGRFAIIR